MNLHQLRVLNALFRVPAEFTTVDLMRETGVSAEVVRKTYQRYAPFFEVVGEKSSGKSGRRTKVRRLAPSAKGQLEKELYHSRSLLPPPLPSRGTAGEPFGLLAAERVMYELLPGAGKETRTRLLRKVRMHLKFAEQECATDDQSEHSRLSPAQRSALEARFDTLRRIRHYVEVLHNSSVMLLDNGVPQYEVSVIDELSVMLLNPVQSADDLTPAAAKTPVARLVPLAALQAVAPDEVKNIAHALLALDREPAWHTALGVPNRVWASQEEVFLESLSTWSGFPQCTVTNVRELTHEDIRELTKVTTGTVKWFNLTKGFGFIQPDSGGPDAFVHISAVERAGLSSLNEGQRVKYDLVAGRNGKSSAENLRKR